MTLFADTNNENLAPPTFFVVPEAGSQGRIDSRDGQKVVEFTFAGNAASGPYLADINVTAAVETV